MEKLIEIIKDKFAQSVMILFGMVAPGVGTIFVFDRALFIQLDIIKLLILAATITMPSFSMLFGVILLKRVGGNNLHVIHLNYALLMALYINILPFLASLAIKVLYYNDMTIQLFCQLIVIITVTALLYYLHRIKGIDLSDGEEDHEDNSDDNQE